MLDLFYFTEKPLPNDRDELYSALRVSLPEEKAAVEFVLKKFWRGAGGRVHGFVQQRAVKELANYKQYRAKQSSAGKASALARNHRSTQAKLRFNPPPPPPQTTKPPYPPYVSSAAATAPPAPVNGGPKLMYVERYGEVVEIDLGKHKRLPSLDSMTGARAQVIADYLTHKGYPSKVVPKG